MNVLDRSYIWLVAKMNQMKTEAKDFFSSQDGVANVVATIVVLLITVLLIAAFWGRLRSWMSDLVEKIFNTGEEMNFETLGG